MAVHGPGSGHEKGVSPAGPSFVIIVERQLLLESRFGDVRSDWKLPGATRGWERQEGHLHWPEDSGLDIPADFLGALVRFGPLQTAPTTNGSKPQCGLATHYLLYTSLCTGELNAIRKHKCFLCSPFYGRACRWAMLGELKPKGPKGSTTDGVLKPCSAPGRRSMLNMNSLARSVHGGALKTCTPPGRRSILTLTILAVTSDVQVICAWLLRKLNTFICGC